METKQRHTMHVENTLTEKSLTKDTCFTAEETLLTDILHISKG